MLQCEQGPATVMLAWPTIQSLQQPSARSLWRSLQLLLMQTDVNGTWSNHNLYSLRMLLCLPGTGRGWYDAAPTEQRWKAGQPGNVDPSSGNAFRSWRHR